MLKSHRLKTLLLLASALGGFAFAPSRLGQGISHHGVAQRADAFNLRKNHGRGGRQFELAQLRYDDSNDWKISRRGIKSFWRRFQKDSSKLSASVASEDTPKNNKLDTVLSRLTSAFPFFVLGSAIMGLMRPSTLMWTNRGSLISWMLALVMCGTGLTLERKDFAKVLKEDLGAVPAGVLCQFMIMPLTALLLGRTLLLKSVPYGPSLFLGLCLVGCSPGGTASNLVALIAKADVALSVLLTSASTILASVVTPVLVKLLVGSSIQVSGWALCEATARVVLLPVAVGMFVNAKAPNLATRVSRFTPFASVLLVSLICGGVVSQNSALLFESSSLVPLIVGAVLALHCVGFLVGYLIPKLGLGFSEQTCRTISIETGMQNSALAVVLARSIGAPPVASLPGALSATAHSCLGSMLAGYWHGRQQIDGREVVFEENPRSSESSSNVLTVQAIEDKVVEELETVAGEAEELAFEIDEVVDQTDSLPEADKAVVGLTKEETKEEAKPKETKTKKGAPTEDSEDSSKNVVLQEEDIEVLETAVANVNADPEDKECVTKEETKEEAKPKETETKKGAPTEDSEDSSKNVVLQEEDIEVLETAVADVNAYLEEKECVIEEEPSETEKLMKQVKDAGSAGVISYALWELGFWTISVPVCIIGYHQVAGHWPNFSDEEDLQKLGAEAFAFVNFARFAVPLRIGLALGTTPWIQANIVDRFMKKDDDENKCEPVDEE